MFPAISEMMNVVRCDELDVARSFFGRSSSSELDAIASEYRKEQPMFSVLRYLWRCADLDPCAIGILQRSIFEVYYVLTFMQSKVLCELTESDVRKHIRELIVSRLVDAESLVREPDGEFIRRGVFKNVAIFDHSADAIRRAFGSERGAMEKGESLMYYFGCLKALEVAGNLAMD